MKVFGKWLVIGIVNNASRIASSGYPTKKATIEALDMAGFKRTGDNEWQDSLGQKFHIEKNTKEYR